MNLHSTILSIEYEVVRVVDLWWCRCSQFVDVPVGPLLRTFIFSCHTLLLKKTSFSWDPSRLVKTQFFSWAKDPTKNSNSLSSDMNGTCIYADEACEDDHLRLNISEQKERPGNWGCYFV